MIHDTFSDAQGHVYVGGKEVREVRAVGWVHKFPCPRYAIASVQIGEPYICDCEGTVLMGWRDWWPLPDEPSQSIVIDCSEDDEGGGGS